MGLLIAGAAGRGLRDESPSKDSIRDGGAYGTPPIRDSNYGTEGAYGTSFLYGTEARRASRDSFITDGGAYGTSLLMGLLIARRRDLRDEPPFRDRGAYETSLLTALVITGRRRLRDEPPYATGRRRLRDELLAGRRLGGPYGPDCLWDS